MLGPTRLRWPILMGTNMLYVGLKEGRKDRKPYVTHQTGDVQPWLQLQVRQWMSPSLPEWTDLLFMTLGKPN